MEKLHWFRLAVNFSILTALFLAYLCLKYVVEPSKNAGFYCNDFSITLPFKEETVNEAWLHVISIVMPFFVLLATESMRAFYARHKGSLDAGERNKYRIVLPCEKELHLREYIGNMFVNYEYFLFGFALNACLTMLVKVLISRLRPNFLSICNPRQDPYESLCVTRLVVATASGAGTNSLGLTKFIVPGIHFPCAPSVNKSLLAESRRSFPSGHASFSFYTMAFLIFYIDKFWTKRQLGLMPHFAQSLCFGLAVFVSLSRILDNMHHATDVLTGSALGVLIAAFTFYNLKRFYTRHNYISKYDMNNNEMETFIEDQQNTPTRATINLPAMEIKYDI